MGNHFFIRLKLLLQDKPAVFCYLASVVILLILFVGLDNAAEDRSAVPIGLVVNDDSIEADELAEKIRQNKAFFVYEKNQDELEGMLMDDYINSIFIIDKGSGEKLLAGDTDKMLTVISGEDDRMSVILSDIIAGDMVYDISLHKSYNKYRTLGDKSTMTRDEYKAYTDAYLSNPEFNMPIEFKYMESKVGNISEREVTNGMIYRQMIAGMICMLLSIVAFTACNGICLEHEKGIRRRRDNTPKDHLAQSLVDFLAVYLFTLPVGFFAGYLLKGISGAAISCVYLLVILLICFAAARFIKSLSAYQLVGVIIVAGLGVAGFVSAFSGIVGGGEFLKYTPNGAFIEWFMK